MTVLRGRLGVMIKDGEKWQKKKKSGAVICYPNPPICSPSYPGSIHFSSKSWFFFNTHWRFGSCWKPEIVTQGFAAQPERARTIQPQYAASALLQEHNRCVYSGFVCESILYITSIFCEQCRIAKLFVCCLTINALIMLWFCRIMSYIWIVMMSQACQ